MTTTRLAQILQHEITEEDARKIRAFLDTEFPEKDAPPATAPHITRTVGYGGTADADCRLCGAHASSHSLWATQDTDTWAQAHAADCTPDTVRQKAAHLRYAAGLIDDMADAGDPALWDEGDGKTIADHITNRLHAEAIDLEHNADTAEETTR